MCFVTVLYGQSSIPIGWMTPRPCLRSDRSVAHLFGAVRAVLTARIFTRFALGAAGKTMGKPWDNRFFCWNKNMGKPSIFRLISKAMCETYSWYHGDKTIDCDQEHLGLSWRQLYRWMVTHHWRTQTWEPSGPQNDYLDHPWHPWHHHSLGIKLLELPVMVLHTWSIASWIMWELYPRLQDICNHSGGIVPAGGGFQYCATGGIIPSLVLDTGIRCISFFWGKHMSFYCKSFKHTVW